MNDKVNLKKINKRRKRRNGSRMATRTNLFNYRNWNRNGLRKLDNRRMVERKAGRQ